MNTVETLLMVGEGGKQNPMINVVFMSIHL